MKLKALLLGLALICGAAFAIFLLCSTINYAIVSASVMMAILITRHLLDGYFRKVSYGELVTAFEEAQRRRYLVKEAYPEYFAVFRRKLMRHLRHWPQDSSGRMIEFTNDAAEHYAD